MKTTLLSLLHLLVAFSFCCNTSTASTNPNNLLQEVLDSEEETLRSDAWYYVMPAILGPSSGGGVYRAFLVGDENGAGDANSACILPLQVLQAPIVADGSAVRFLPKAPRQVNITESTDLNIEFYQYNPSSLCASSTVWNVDGFRSESPFDMYYLSTTGDRGNTLQVNSWFQIKKFGATAYKLVFCPRENACSDIGTDAGRRLGVGIRSTFVVQFIKAPLSGKSII